MFARIGRESLHHLNPCNRRVSVGTLERGPQQMRYDLLEVAFGDGGMPVTGKDDLALLRDLEVRRGDGAWTCQYRPAHRATTSPDRAAAPMKQPQLDTRLRGCLRQRHLSTMCLPGAADVAAIFIA